MILPIGDAPNPRGHVAWVNGLLILVNILVFLGLTLPLGGVAPDPADPALARYLQAMGRALGGADPRALLPDTSAYTLFVFEHGFRPADPSAADLFKALFLHAGFAHLAGNLLFLYIYGNNVEHRLGRLGYLFAYLGTGIAATLGYGLLAGDSELPLIGASGAISGVLGHYFVLYPQNRVRLLVLLPFYVRTVFLSARWVLGIYLVADNLVPILVHGSSGSVAHGAHIGGFLAGMALAAIGDRLGWGLGGLVRDPAWFGDARSPAQQSLAHGLRRMQAGQHAAAWHHLIRALEQAPDPETRQRTLAALHALEADLPPHPRVPLRPG
jgi:membrane associated rhomboid family serine protease